MLRRPAAFALALIVLLLIAACSGNGQRTEGPSEDSVPITRAEALAIAKEEAGFEPDSELAELLPPDTNYSNPYWSVFLRTTDEVAIILGLENNFATVLVDAVTGEVLDVARV